MGWNAQKVDTSVIDPADKEKPADWDEEEDGVWQAPKAIPNPLYKGEFQPRKVPPNLKEIIDILTPVQKKHGKKLLFTIQDASPWGGAIGVHKHGTKNPPTEDRFTGVDIRWNRIDYDEGRT